MSDKGFTFSSAPNSAGGLRGVSRQVAAVLGGAKFLKGKANEGDSLSLADRKELMETQAQHKLHENVSKQVLGEMTADAAHKRTQRAERSGAKRKAAEENLSHSNKKDYITHNFDTLTNAATNPTFSGINLSSGSATFNREKAQSRQFDGVSGDTSSKPPTRLE